MSERDIWLAVYRECRQRNDDHATAIKNAGEAVNAAKVFSST